MPLDAICMTALTAELRETLLGGKVDKIYQPTRDEVVLHMRIGHGNVKLLPVAPPAHDAVGRAVEMVPEMFEKVTGYIDKKTAEKQSSEDIPL